MSAVLVVSCNKVLVQKFELSQPRVVVGRSQRCDLVLQDRELSREHTEIVKAGSVFKVSDMGSRNGTDVNGQTIAEPHVLKDGDVITLGDYQLTFYSAGAAVPEDESGPVDMEDAATRFVGEVDVKKSVVDPSKKPKVTADMICKIDIESGPLKGEVHKNWEGDLTIGRGLDNNIVFPEDAVSTNHARVFLKDGHHYLEDLGSSNGVFVNTVRLRQPQMLNHGDKIRVGVSTMAYSALDPKKQRKMRIRLVLVAVLVLGGLLAAKVLQPEDKAAKYTAIGNGHLDSGNYKEATDWFMRALEAQPEYVDAKTGLSRAKSEQEAVELLAQAERAAVEEKYDEALDICNRVLRLYPKHDAATALLDVLGQVDKATVATRAQNWPAAIQLLGKALQAYPDSEVLKLRFDQAKSEEQARTSLTSAQDFLKQDKFEEGRKALEATPPDSMYHQESQDLIKKINDVEFAAQSYARAMDSYSKGYADQAVAEIDKGLARYPEHVGLKALKEDIGMITPLMQQISSGQELLGSSDVAAIRRMIENCNSMINIRASSEVVENFKTSARDLQELLRARLKSLSKASTEQGQALQAGGNTRDALKAFVLAAEADSENTVARAAAESIRAELVPMVQDKLRQALVSMELGQDDIAKEGFEEVLTLAIPGDGFYERAQKELEKLSRR